MPYTLILHVTRKPGLTPPAFKHHWEKTHIPLLKSIVGEDFPLSHTRHYVELSGTSSSPPIDPATLSAVGPPPSETSAPNTHYQTENSSDIQEHYTFDAIVVLTFANQPHWERFLAKCKQGGVKERLEADEALFMDRGLLKGYLVGETKSTGRDGGDMGWRFVGSI